jgi:hypothetical protein
VPVGSEGQTIARLARELRATLDGPPTLPAPPTLAERRRGVIEILRRHAIIDQDIGGAGASDVD